MTSNCFTNKRGFTLIEMLVAVLLLTLAIGGPLTISSKGLMVALVAKDQTTAFYLAQDAVEYVRFIRDSNRLKGADWLDGSPAPGGQTGLNLSACVSADGSATCYFDTLALAPAPPVSCPSAGCPALNYDTGTKQFTYSSGVNIRPTIFTRTVSITNPNAGADDEAVLMVTVRWSTLAGAPRSITVTEDLFNWQ